MNNLFRCTRDGSLDRLYLRTCAIYRLLKIGRINKAEALRLQNKRYANSENQPARDYYQATRPPRDYLTKTIEIWLSGPLKSCSAAEQAIEA